VNVRIVLLTAIVLFVGVPAFASEEVLAPEHQHWHFKGITGSYDQAAMQRGLKVYREVCSACHSLKRVNFRNLEALGYDEGQVKAIASEYNVTDGPDDEGEMFERPARPSDAFPSPYANDKAAVAANGALPPDLSLITKARHHGPDYVYSLLTGYDDPGHVAEIPTGKHWNKYFPGHVISMAPPLSDDQVVYEDGSPQTVEQYAHDVVNFLTWVADPSMEDRKRTGIKVLIFLAVFAGVMYAVKRKIWSRLH
jgi:ubiquinol-cytochrome c reductase cytochrome c1 subunit